MDNWFLLILSSALSLGFYDFCKKHAVNANHVMTTLFWATVAGSVIIVGATVLTGNFTRLFFCPWREWWLILLKSAIVATSWVAGYFALHDLPISIAAPIRASSPVWVALGGICLFGERPSLPQFLGMAVVFIGYYLFNNIGHLEGFSWRSRGVKMVIAATLVGSASALYDRFLMHTLHLDANRVQLHFAIDLVLILGGVLLVQKTLPILREETKFQWRWSIPAIGLFLAIADWTFFHAVASADAQISILGILRRLSVVVSFALGAWLLHEKHVRAKFWALACILVGVCILGIFK
ncbi:MAG: DMT family transporter [Victivallales bacterium]|nr:DMT family transporter [Victivallales bacterium]